MFLLVSWREISQINVDSVVEGADDTGCTDLRFWRQVEVQETIESYIFNFDYTGCFLW